MRALLWCISLPIFLCKNIPQLTIGKSSEQNAPQGAVAMEKERSAQLAWVLLWKVRGVLI
jgi:hypothetical protein